MSDPAHRLPDGKVGKTMLSWTGPKWPTLRELWCWLRQGCPTDFPVVTRQGELTVTVPEGESGDVVHTDWLTISDWEFQFTFMPTGVMRMSDVARGITERYPIATLVWPDGRRARRELIIVPDQEMIG